MLLLQILPKVVEKLLVSLKVAQKLLIYAKIAQSNSTTFHRSFGMRNQVETQKERSKGSLI